MLSMMINREEMMRIGKAVKATALSGMPEVKDALISGFNNLPEFTPGLVELPAAVWSFAQRSLAYQANNAKGSNDQETFELDSELSERIASDIGPDIQRETQVSMALPFEQRRTLSEALKVFPIASQPYAARVSEALNSSKPNEPMSVSLPDLMNLASGVSEYRDFNHVSEESSLSLIQCLNKNMGNAYRDLNQRAASEMSR